MKTKWMKAIGAGVALAGLLGFSAGCGEDAQTDSALGISPATVKRDWTAARAWLNRELTS